MRLPCLLFVFSVWQFSHAAPLTRRMVDLTHVFDNTTMYYPTMKKYDMEMLFRGYMDVGNNRSIWLQMEEYSSGIHVGTHMDAPLHFYKDGWTADEIPIERFIAPAAVVDMSEKAENDRDYEMTIEDLVDWETKTGQKLNEVILLMRSGWSKRWHNRELFTGSPEFGPSPTLSTAKLHYPGIHADAAQWLVDNRNIYGIGTETLSIDHGPSTELSAHVILQSQNIFIMENIDNMDDLPLYGATLYAMPSKLGGASGAPVRLIATFPVVVSGTQPCNHHNEDDH